MQFELLNESHSSALLSFELSNRTYFESYIAPRDETFYSLIGVQKQIRDSQDVAGRSFVLLKNGAIVARANIKNIQSTGNAEIGYRVSEHEAGKGTGTACVIHLLTVAKELGIHSLSAFVINNNPASERVLLKNGFHLHLCIPNGFLHQGTLYHGFQYIRKLT